MKAICMKRVVGGVESELLLQLLPLCDNKSKSRGAVGH